jgi:predicted site-specific integrase-resolvase
VTKHSTASIRDDLIDAHEAADIFGVHYVTLRKWVKAGNVPSTRMPNGRVKLSRSWCEEQLLKMDAELNPNGGTP